MPALASLTTKKTMEALSIGQSVAAVLSTLSLEEGLSLPSIAPGSVVPQNVAAELSEKSLGAKYPLLYVYCTKIVNELREKFRRFSGQAHMVVEARISQDRLEGIETNLQVYVDAIIQVLDANRGDWGDGFTYGGGYEVAFTSVKHGGSNFIQMAKVSFVVEISTD